MRFVLFVLSAAVLFGTTGTSQAFAPDGASSMSIGMARLGFGGLLLGLIGCVSWWRNRSRLSRPTWRMVLAIAVGVVCILGFQATFFAGTRTIGVMVGTVIALGAAPPFTGLIEWLVLRRRPSLRWGVATLFAVGGVIALSWATGTDLRVDPVGVLLSLIAGASYATLAVMMKWLLDHGWRSSDAVAAIMGVGGIAALLVLSTTDASWLAQPRGLGVTAWLAVATMVAAYLLMSAGLSGLPAASATTLGLAEPATAALLGTLVLGEPMTPTRAIGLAAIAAGVLVIGLARPRPPEPD